MAVESEYFLHLTCGGAGGATALMARIALNLGHDARAFPVGLADIKNVTELSLQDNEALASHNKRARRALNEFFLTEMLRQATLSSISWREDQVVALTQLAGPPASAKLHILRFENRTAKSD